jgi:3-deoxy-D-manno-octulosonate 8-phosphate phosphatase (KDO 8-P phosphatase)
MNLLDQFKKIKTFVFDMDGVLTDGTLIVQSGTEWLRKMHIRDGYAIKEATDKGYRIVIISGSSSGPVKKRLKLLGVKDVYMSECDKKERLAKYMKKHALNADEILYMGDDIPDYGVMKIVGLASMPNDGADELKTICKYISPYKGGEGCVRDVIEKVLKLNNDWIVE